MDKGWGWGNGVNHYLCNYFWDSFCNRNENLQPKKIRSGLSYAHSYMREETNCLEVIHIFIFSQNQSSNRLFQHRNYINHMFFQSEHQHLDNFLKLLLLLYLHKFRCSSGR